MNSGELNMTKQYKHFRIGKEQGLQAQYIAKRLGITEVKLFEDYINQIFPLALSWGKEELVIHYLPSITSSYVMVQLLGRKRLLTTFKAYKVPEDEKSENAVVAKKLTSPLELNDINDSFSNICKRMSRAKTSKKVKKQK